MTRIGVRDHSGDLIEGIVHDRPFQQANGLAHVTGAVANALSRLEDSVRAAKAKPFDAKNSAGGFQAAKEGWLKVVISYPNLAGADYAVAVAISTHFNSKTAVAWPSIERLAAMTNRNRSTVWRAIEKLRKHKLLDVRKGRGRNVPNQYRPLLGLIDCDPKRLRRRTKKTVNSQPKDCELAVRTLDNL